ncbi:hypothetical protein [Mesorhizobium sp. M0478]|uniref:hypothetical protein n=1 Tax=Mesorhizobium sp. M0478 TaxID=2956947 RepID=UPI0033388B7B
MPTFVASLADDNPGLHAGDVEPDEAASAGGQIADDAAVPMDGSPIVGGAVPANNNVGTAAPVDSSDDTPGAAAHDALGSAGAALGANTSQIEPQPTAESAALQALRMREDFRFKVGTVKWFGILCAVVIVAMIGLGFWYLDRIVDVSQALQSDMNFSKVLDAPQSDSQIVLLGLEHDGLGMRNKRSVSALYMRAYTQFLAIISGTVLALLGAVFVLARVDSLETRGNGTWGGITMALSSSSPGVVVAIVGTLLVGSVVYLASDPIKVTDAPVFLGRGTLGGALAGSAADTVSLDEQMRKRLEDLR